MSTEIELLNEAQAGHLLGISRSTLRRLMVQQRLRPVRIGRSVRFTTSELRRSVSELEAEAAAANDR